MDWCAINNDTDSVAELKATLECDYDKNITNLYQAIERGAWDSILNFLTTEKWSFLTFTKDYLSPESQTRTWVTRFDPNGKVRWSQLPLHAAILFLAPRNVVKALIDLYPLSVQCTDDQRMLPLHLAVRVGAKDSIMNLLIKCFPGALVTGNHNGKFPYAIEGRDMRKEYTESVQRIVKHVTQKVIAKERSVWQQKTDDLEEALEEQSKLVQTLENNTKNFKQELSDAKIEIAVMKERCRMLERIVAGQKTTPVPHTIVDNTVEKEIAEPKSAKVPALIIDNTVERRASGSKSASVPGSIKMKTSSTISSDEIATIKISDGKDNMTIISKITNASTRIDENSTVHDERITNVLDADDVKNSRLIPRKYFELVDILDPEPTVATSEYHSTNASMISSVNLNSVQHHKESNNFPRNDSRKLLVVAENQLNQKRADSEATLCQNSKDTFITSSEHRNSIGKQKTPDICWSQMKQTLCNRTDIPMNMKEADASVISTLDLDSAQQHKELDIFPHDDSKFIRKTSVIANTDPKGLDSGGGVHKSIRNASTIDSLNLTSNQPYEVPDIALRYKTEDKFNNSTTDFILRESTEKLIEMIPNEKETRADKETSTRQKGGLFCT